MHGFSIPLLLEKITQPIACEVVSGAGGKYFDARIMPGDASRCEPGILYAAPKGAAWSGVAPAPAGVVLLGAEGDDFAALFNLLAASFSSLRASVGAIEEAAASRAPLRAMIEMVGDITDNPSYITDSSFSALAIDARGKAPSLCREWQRTIDEGRFPYDIVGDLIESGDIERMESCDHPMIMRLKRLPKPFINVNLSWGGKLIGHLFTIGIYKDITPGDAELAGILGRVITRAIPEEARRERGRVHEYFLNDVLSGKLGDEYIMEQMRKLGFSAGGSHAVVVASPLSGGPLAAERALCAFELLPGCCPALCGDGHVAAILHSSGAEAAVSALALKYSLAAGMSDVFVGFSRIADCRAQAEEALAARGSEPGVTNYGAVAMSRARHGLGSAIRRAEPAPLDILREHDKTRGTDLIRTLKIYIESERSIAAAAQELGVHRNTMTYRVNRIEELCGLDLNDRELRKRILLALE